MSGWKIGLAASLFFVFNILFFHTVFAAYTIEISGNGETNDVPSDTNVFQSNETGTTGGDVQVETDSGTTSINHAGVNESVPPPEPPTTPDTPETPESPEAPESPPAPGLKVDYFDNINLSGNPVDSRSSSKIDNDWGSGAPEGLPIDNFSARWTGQIEISSSGEYTFYTITDDGVRLWVDDQLLIENWTDHAWTEDLGSITLEAGQKYNVRMEYYEKTGGAVAQLLWEGPNISKQIVPTDVLFTTYNPAAETHGLEGKYFNGVNYETLGFERIDSTINFDWAQSHPGLPLYADNFSVRWTGQVKAPVTGPVTFVTQSDDGVRLWVDDQLLIDNWTDHANTQDQAPIDLVAGQKYNLKLEYYERGGGAIVQLLWQYPGQNLEIIPTTYLYSQIQPTPEVIKVLQVNYFGTGVEPTDPNQHPTQKAAFLENFIEESSKYHGYKNPGATPQVDVQITRVVNRYTPLPGADNNIYTWIPSYQQIMHQDDLCMVIETEAIDQVWLMTDYASDEDLILHSFFDTNLLNRGQNAVVAESICNTVESIQYLGGYFEWDNWHLASTFGYLNYNLLAQVQGDLFVQQFLGFASYPIDFGNRDFSKCGTPGLNGNNTSPQTTICENWQPNATETTTYTCELWGCTHEGHVQWWFQNLPPKHAQFQFEGQEVPFWWNFIIDFDQTVLGIFNDARWYLNRSALNISPSQNGLQADLFEDINLESGFLSEIHPNIDNNWGSGSPQGLANDNFSIRWTGQILAPSTNEITFYTYTDDGVRLWVNNQLIIDNWTDHAPTENSGTISLEQAQWYNIKMEYYERGGGAVAQLFWSGPGISKQIVPDLVLKPTYEQPETPLEPQKPETLRVLELRYFPYSEADALYHPDDLSAQLQQLLSQASKYHGYNNPDVPSGIEVEVVDVINRNYARPNPDGTRLGTTKAILEDGDLCQTITELDVDQLWMWVDPRTGKDEAPGWEYIISSPLFTQPINPATVASTPLCGNHSFVFMGFDYSRTPDLALHSFGHYLEGLLGNTQRAIWSDFTGYDALDNQPGTGSSTCGNVHFPPNGTQDYDYNNTAQVTSSCQSWNAEYDVNGPNQTFDCTIWGCSQQGFLVWWMQNMPGIDNALTFAYRPVPNWWYYVTDFEAALAYTNRYDLQARLGSAFENTSIPLAPFYSRYFNGLNFDAIALIQLEDTIVYDWSMGSPHQLINNDNFSAIWTANLIAPESGTYTFYTSSDDGVRLSINGSLVIDNWTDHPAMEDSASVELLAGDEIRLQLEYYERGGGSLMKLEWTGPTFDRQPVSDMIY